MRLGLFLLHIVLLFGTAFSLVPDDYAFQFGASAGSVLLYSTILLWFLLIFAKTRRLVLLFCALVLAQLGFVALIGLQFRAEERALRPIWEGLTSKRYEWTSQLAEIRLDPLFDMTSGKRQLSITELRELQIRAREGQQQVERVKADMIRTRADAEHRLSAVSPRAAQGFRLGLETSRPVYEKDLELLKAYYGECEQLLGFLIDRQGQYSQTREGLRFQKTEDVQLFNDRAKAIELLQKEIASLAQQLPQN